MKRYKGIDDLPIIGAHECKKCGRKGRSATATLIENGWLVKGAQIVCPECPLE